jgi:hypothetical protein
MNPLVSSGFVRSYNVDHPERTFDVYHNPEYRSAMFPPDLSLHQGCLCNEQGRDPLCTAEWVAVPYADFCRALGFDPRREVLHVGGNWSTESTAVYDQGDFDLEEQMFIPLRDQNQHFQNIRSQRGAYEALDDPFAWVDFANPEVLLEVGGGVSEPDEHSGFWQAPLHDGHRM